MCVRKNAGGDKLEKVGAGSKIVIVSNFHGRLTSPRSAKGLLVRRRERTGYKIWNKKIEKGPSQRLKENLYCYPVFSLALLFRGLIVTVSKLLNKLPYNLQLIYTNEFSSLDISWKRDPRYFCSVPVPAWVKINPGALFQWIFKKRFHRFLKIKDISVLLQFHVGWK